MQFPKKKYLQGFYPSFFSSSPLAFRSQANLQNWADALAQTIWCVQWNWGCCTTARFVLTTWSVGLWRVGNTSSRFRFCSSNMTLAAPLSKFSWMQHWQTKVVSMLGGFITWTSGMIRVWLLNHHLCGMFKKKNWNVLPSLSYCLTLSIGPVEDRCGQHEQCTLIHQDATHCLNEFGVAHLLWLFLLIQLRKCLKHIYQTNQLQH